MGLYRRDRFGLGEVVVVFLALSKRGGKAGKFRLQEGSKCCFKEKK